MSSTSSLFFFYGTLRRGFWNHWLISSRSTFQGTARTVEPFQLFVGKEGLVPTAVPAKDGVPLKGELWLLTLADAKSVHALEIGYVPGQFEVEILGNAERHVATIFHTRSAEDCFYMRGGAELIPSGDYADRVSTDGSRKVS